MEKIIDRILSDLRFTPTLFNDFCSENNIDKSSRSAFKSSLETAKENLSKEKENIKNNLPTYRIERVININRKKYDFWGERVPVYGDKKIYPPGTDLKQVEKDNKRINLIENYLYRIELMLQIVNLYPEKESTPTNENENNIKVSNKYSEYGELNNLLYEFLDLPEFEALKIPKHETLKSNHLAAIKKLLTTKFPDFPVDEKWNSFLTKLKRLDYSRSRD